jgi:hypothetical protein
MSFDDELPDAELPEADDSEARLAERRAQEYAPLEEAGQGESEGFELAEQDLIDHASHGDQHTTAPIGRDGFDDPEEDPEVSGEADQEELPD